MHVSWVAAGEWRSRQALGKKEDVSKGTGGRGVKQTLEKEGAVHGAGQQAGEERGVVHGEGSNVILLPMLFFLGVMSAAKMPALVPPQDEVPEATWNNSCIIQDILLLSWQAKPSEPNLSPQAPTAAHYSRQKLVF